MTDQGRRSRIGTALASGLQTTTVWGKTIKHKPLDPVNPDILFGTTSSIWTLGVVSGGGIYGPGNAGLILHHP